MKFMFFNLMVVVAILYLVAVEGKPTNSLPEFLTSASSKDVTRKGADLAKRARRKLKNFKAMVEPSETDVKKTPEAVAAKVKSSQKFTPTVTSKVTTKSTAKPQPVKVATRPVHKVTTKSTAKPQPVKVATRSVHIVPPISEVKSLPRAKLKPVTKPTPNLMSSIVEQPQKQKFMSRAERRRELNRLAHDMEMMFVDKISD